MADHTEEDRNDELRMKELGLDIDTPITEENKNRNDGKWCKIFREAQKIKQLEISGELGVTQQAVSKIENRKILSEKVLDVYARACRVEVNMIKNMPEIGENANNIFRDHSQQLQYNSMNNVTFNPIDKVVALCEDKDRLHREIIDKEKAQNEEYKNLINTLQATLQGVNDRLEKIESKQK